MKKRRVLALLLALSLAVSTNGMTVFAAEAGELTASVVSPVEESTEDVQDEAELTDTAEDDADDEQDIESEDTEKSDESDGDSAENQTGKDDDGTNDGEDSDEQNPDVEDAADETGETVSENELPDEEEPAEESEELPQVIKHEVRMMTFTDDTGLKVTYDANAARNYKYIVENGVLTKVQEAKTVGENGEPAWEDVTFTGNVELIQPEEGEKYTSVAAGIFSGNKNITYVKLPDGVTGIEDNTFKDCTGLKGVYLPATVTSIGASAFESCTSMTQIAVPKAVTAIGNSAFKNDAKLYMVYMKDVDYSALTSIGDSAFEGCTALAEFCSDTEFHIPATLKTIGGSAFKGCKSIKKVDLNTAKLETMGASAFENCTGLTDAEMCGTLASIPLDAFKDCGALELLTFNSRTQVTIGESAFQGCFRLRKVELPTTVIKVSNYAFAGCTNLTSVVVENPLMELGATAPFPAGDTTDCLVFVGKKYHDKDATDMTAIYAYSLKFDATKVAFVDPSENNSKQYYKYKVVNSQGAEATDGKITGGQIWVGPEDDNHFENNINKSNGNKGVPSDTTKYYIYYKQDDGYQLVAGSIKSNGETVQKDDKGYGITMPFGGTVITAEFQKTGSTDTIEGVEKDVTVEFSNGEPIQSGGGVELKVGQTTRMFLLDKNGKPISSSQIEKIDSDKPKIATVSKSGVITAVSQGTATVTVELIGEDGKHFLIRRIIKVVEAEIDSIRLEASKYSSNIEVSSSEAGIQTAAVLKNYAKDGLKITLKAHVYTAEKEGVAKDLTWKSSDTSVAKLQKASTTTTDSSNVAEIQPGCEGEATITVSAKINSKKTVTQKFVVSVRNENVKLASSSITLNPNLEECGELEILSSYGAKLSSKKPEIVEKVGDILVTNNYFLLTEKSQPKEDDKSRRYGITLADPDMRDGKYNVFVCFAGAPRDESMPLTITVKRSVPAPTVKFNTQKTKFNLFYKDGGKGTDGKPITVTTEVTKLGKVRISDAELCALSDDKQDDLLFLDNFEIVKSPEDLAKGIITIRRKAGNLKYTQAKKPAVTGYLKLYYEGYNSNVAKLVKVTMPTVTTAPAYVLDRTAETYRDTALEQQEKLKLLDKKTKQQIILDHTKIVLSCESDQAIIKDAVLNQDSEITFKVDRNPVKDKAKFILKNPTEWDRDKDGQERELSYTFNVKVTNAEPTITTDQIVTLNLNYPEVAGTFGLKSNQRDTVIDGDQIFTAKSTARNEIEYNKLYVSYENGKGTVKILGEKPKAGTYKWTCTPKEIQGSVSVPLKKAATLTVKVVDAKPVVKLGKGSLVLNLATRTVRDNVIAYEETAEIPLKITGKPEGYTLDTSVNMGSDSTKIECTNKNASGAAANFDWTLQDATTDEDGKLSVSIKDSNPPTTGTYSFKLTAKYVSLENSNVVDAKPMTFKVKVDNNNAISVTFSAKGKLNLVDREGEYTEKNTIVYTPTLKNVRGTITGAWIYDVDTNEESKRFDIYLNPVDGKLYVTPKKTLVNIGTGGGDENGDGNETGGGDENGDGNETGGGDENGDGNETGGGDENGDGNETGGGDENGDGNETGGGDENGNGNETSGGSVSGNDTGDGNTTDNGDENSGNNSEDRPSTQSDVVQGYEYASLDNNCQYRVRIEVKVSGYNDGRGDHEGILSTPITIKTAQVLPKVTTDKTTLDVYLSNKQYDATFTVTPQEGAAGIVEEIKFHDDDEVSRDAFDISYVMQPDGSLKVTVHLKEAVAYKCDSTNKVKMYIKFKGQGTNTEGTLVNMNIRVNK